jgi:putative phage-type endonuclease
MKVKGVWLVFKERPKIKQMKKIVKEFLTKFSAAPYITPKDISNFTKDRAVWKEIVAHLNGPYYNIKPESAKECDEGTKDVPAPILAEMETQALTSNTEDDIALTYKRRENRLHQLQNKPQSEQRSKEWYEMRQNMITASDIATALGQNKYESPESLLLKKVGLGTPFAGNEHTRWGQKYEPIAALLYEELNKVKLLEFGLIQHDQYSFLGASPDGICANGPSVGRLIEIKCPKVRRIEKGVCPIHYLIQVQIQLEVCDLDECDFFQCKILEVSLSEFDNSTRPKGVVLENPDGTYTYPETLQKTNEEWQKWIAEKDNTKYSYFVVDFYDNKLIKRDTEWFSKSLPKLRDFWNQVLVYRNPDKKKELMQVFLDE